LPEKTGGRQLLKNQWEASPWEIEDKKGKPRGNQKNLLSLCREGGNRGKAQSVFRRKRRTERAKSDERIE